MYTDFVVLAAGKGQRMLGNFPKVLEPLGGKPMVQHLIDTTQEITNSRPIIVIGEQAEKVKKSLVTPRNTKWSKQKKQLGTGHAVKTAFLKVRPSAIVVVLYGDVPLVESKTLKSLINIASNNRLAILTFLKEKPKGYGRILRNSRNQVEAIVEERDATIQERRIKEVNSGILAIKASKLKKLLPLIKNNNLAKEYYLTDLVDIAKRAGLRTKPLLLADPEEAQGANTLQELQELERIYQKRRAQKILESGVRIADISRIDIRGDLKAERGAFIDVNSVFEGHVTLGANVMVGPNCYIRDSEIGKNTVIKANTVIEDSLIGNECRIGPFSRVRGGTEVESFSELGNFVEANRSKVGKSSKAKHLTYLGDARLGSRVNIGAGTITCNYDGTNKHKTKLSDGVFIGSNTSLVAPLTLGKDSYIGAGSVITKNVPENSLALGRARQAPPIKRKREK